MKIKHYSLFRADLDTLLDPNSWLRLREDPDEPSYCIPDSVQAYEKKFRGDEPTEMAGAVIATAKKLGYERIFSPGCGIGALEYSVKRHSGFEVVVADNNDSVFRLREFGVFDGCEKLDLVEDNLPDLSGTLTLVPRIDTEFSDGQLTMLGSKFAAAGAKHLFFIPAQMITWRTPLIELKILLKALVSRRKRTFCGYSRTKGHLVKLFGSDYRCETLAVAESRILLFEAKGVQ